MPLYVTLQGAAISIAQKGGKINSIGIEAATGYIYLCPHIHDALAPHPADTENGDSCIAGTELRCGIIGCTKMEGISCEGAVRPRDLGRSVP